MAKKNSSKTQTQEARSASEPKIQTFAQWGGINIAEQRGDWDYPWQTSSDGVHDENDTEQTDLQPNFLVIQNNVDTTASGKLETRNKAINLPNPRGNIVPKSPVVKESYVIVALDDGRVEMIDLAGELGWKTIPLRYYFGEIGLQVFTPYNRSFNANPSNAKLGFEKTDFSDYYQTGKRLCVAYGFIETDDDGTHVSTLSSNVTVTDSYTQEEFEGSVFGPKRDLIDEIILKNDKSAWGHVTSSGGSSTVPPGVEDDEAASILGNDDYVDADREKYILESSWLSPSLPSAVIEDLSFTINDGKEVLIACGKVPDFKERIKDDVISPFYKVSIPDSGDSNDSKDIIGVTISQLKSAAKAEKDNLGNGAVMLCGTWSEIRDWYNGTRNDDTFLSTEPYLIAPQYELFTVTTGKLKHLKSEDNAYCRAVFTYRLNTLFGSSAVAGFDGRFLTNASLNTRNKCEAFFNMPMDSFTQKSHVQLRLNGLPHIIKEETESITAPTNSKDASFHINAWEDTSYEVYGQKKTTSSDKYNAWYYQILRTTYTHSGADVTIHVGNTVGIDVDPSEFIESGEAQNRTWTYRSGTSKYSHANPVELMKAPTSPGLYHTSMAGEALLTVPMGNTRKQIVFIADREIKLTSGSKMHFWFTWKRKVDKDTNSQWYSEYDRVELYAMGFSGLQNGSSTLSYSNASSLFNGASISSTAIQTIGYVFDYELFKDRNGTITGFLYDPSIGPVIGNKAYKSENQRGSYTLKSYSIATDGYKYIPLVRSVDYYVSVDESTEFILATHEPGAHVHNGVAGLGFSPIVGDSSSTGFFVPDSTKEAYDYRNYSPNKTMVHPWTEQNATCTPLPRMAYYGSTENISRWTTANMRVDDMNTTNGPDATHMKYIDGRNYFWGSPSKPYRIWIGGNVSRELSTAEGEGGAFFDMDPGSELVVQDVHKFKTTSGASIVTVLCSDPNGEGKRFNLVESEMTATSDNQELSWIPEEIANQVGTLSHRSSFVSYDGLYTMTRNGLRVTTSQMEYNSTLRPTLVSGNIEPVFQDRLGLDFKSTTLFPHDERAFFAFGTDDNGSLDNVIFVYDVNKKAYYTYTVGSGGEYELMVDENGSVVPDTLAGLFSVDYEGFSEGVGYCTKNSLNLIPTHYRPVKVEENIVPYLVRTGELSAQNPTTSTIWVEQLEFRFDYFVGDMDILVEGIDHYGRPMKILKRIRESKVQHDTVEFIKVQKRLENYHITMSGTAAFRLTHFLAKAYPMSNRTGIMYGYDSHSHYKDRSLRKRDDSHYVRDYNSLKRTILT